MLKTVMHPLFPSSQDQETEDPERRFHDLDSIAYLGSKTVQRMGGSSADAFYRLRSVPGIGKILALVILYEIHDIERFPAVQDFVSYARLVKCAKESAGKRHGTSGKKIGNVHLKWAFSEASVLFLRANPKGQRYVDKLTAKHGKAKALSILLQIGRSSL
jgi:transposase